MTRTAEPDRARSISAWRMVVAAPASTPQVGWQTTSTPGRRSNSRPTTNFCRLPPGERARFRVRAALAHIEHLGDAADDAARAREIDDAAAHEAFARGVAGQHDIVGERHARHGAVAEALLRYEGGIEAPADINAAAAAIDAVDADGVRPVGAHFARERIEQFVLAIAGDARDRDDLAAAHVERDLVEGGGEGMGLRRGQLVDR